MSRRVELGFLASHRIVLAGTLDTKGEEISYLKSLFEAAGARPLVVDVGICGKPSPIPDVTREEIAALAGKTIDQLVRGNDRGSAVSAMEAGFAKWVRLNAGMIAGILSVGGSGGTTIATAGMRELPLGIPKLMVSTLASGNVRGFVQNSDIVMQHSVVDFSGINCVTRTVLRNAASAMLGMTGLAHVEDPQETSQPDQKPLVAASMFGVTTRCVTRARDLLAASSYELLSFHANGSGGQAMERLARDGFLSGVLDITPAELAADLLGGHFSAGPDRLQAAGQAGIPQVISVGGLDVVAFGPPSTVPGHLRGRAFHVHNSQVTLMRTNREDNAKIGRELARRASIAVGPVSIVLPLRGLSALDEPGQPFHNPPMDEALFEAIRSEAGSRVHVVEVNAHINDFAFSEALVSEFLSIAGPAQIALTNKDNDGTHAR